MFLLMAATLSTPLLKVPLLLGSAVCTYNGMTPPQASASASEIKRIGTISDFLSQSSIPGNMIVKGLIAAAKFTLCSFTLAEASVILARQFPSSLSEYILAHLAPSNALRLTPASAMACAAAISGGLLRVWCHRELGRFFTWEVAVRDNHKLVTSGPYAIVRHPSYTGWLLIIAGNLALLVSDGSYFRVAGLWNSIPGRTVACAVVGYISWVTLNLMTRPGKEDALLKDAFGEEWDAWAGRTPYRLIPWIY